MELIIYGSVYRLFEKNCRKRN